MTEEGCYEEERTETCSYISHHSGCDGHGENPPLTEREHLAAVMADHGIEQEDLHECML